MTRVYVGWTPEGITAYDVTVRSIRKYSDVDIIPLKSYELRYHEYFSRPYAVTTKGQRVDLIDGKAFSTDFSFTRFLVPELEEFKEEKVVFVDGDFLFLDDIGKLIEECDIKYPVSCVKHAFMPNETRKMYGYSQEWYYRKNWSSLMVFNPWLCKNLNRKAVNEMSGSWLHGFEWADTIGSVDPRWNVLFNSTYHARPGAVHFTKGTPDMPLGPKDTSNLHVREWLNLAQGITE